MSPLGPTATDHNLSWVRLLQPFIADDILLSRARPACALNRRLKPTLTMVGNGEHFFASFYGTFNDEFFVHLCGHCLLDRELNCGHPAWDGPSIGTETFC